MLITSYNPTQLGDTLIAILRPDVADQTVESHANVTRISDAETGKTLGYNFFEVSKTLGQLDVNGQVHLTADQVDQLNTLLKANDFEPDLEFDATPKFVVGHVDSAEAHPKSDHLQITKTDVGEDQPLQIVSGSPNMQADILVVVAKVGAMMPDGLIIWPGELRGVESDGMIVSGRELQLPNAPQKPGALILPADYQPVGEPFDFERAQTLFTA
ncbi:hypothetical protein MUDAN_BIHEEGNE_03235 [Lactiplantibacillus mudanjiangensis]|uniref:YtpR family tRNA-binding protein n=1 Tax=Lactiplantibacillus mudanjiangensis TaxID=1296538 RepID=UPI001015C187|nr:DUF4479 and tRNA-binding domain-containing protein [Lactiplantibacillus mudanjiangensis]VDG18354.1 hypothetical protein MUDAN_BIHEEGNE_03235 [Lactiplantibacillus mudanjiangensis]VDG33614.1 hypothetical protein MUDAN_DOGOELCO_02759 [Lactiplantibacillus mudanjiangensis]